MKKQTIIGLGLTGMTVLGSAVTAIIVNKMNRKQLDKIEIKEEIKEEVKDEIDSESETDNNEVNQQDETLNIDDTDIEV